MKRFLISAAILVCLQACSVSGQNKILDRFLSNQNDSTQRTRFLILPAFGYTQETGFNYGLVSLVSFYTDKDTSTRNSSVAGLISFTTKKQSMVTLKPDIWSKQNRYHYIGDLRYKDFPFNFYGVGDRTKAADEEKITQKLVRVGLEAEKLMRRGSYTGVNISYENHQFSDKDHGGIYETDINIRDKDGGEVIFLGLSQILDTRNSNIYSTSGTFLKFNYSYAPDLFGGDNYTGSLVKLDFRTFKSYNPKTVLGFNVNYQTLRGGSAPFYLLPQLGNDAMMRGYYTGRYRNNDLLAAQMEFKYRPIPRVGFVGFAGAGTVYNTRLDFERFKPSFGAGLRYFFDTVKGLSLRMDYGFGEKRSGEERQKGFYLALGEAF